jgi:putative flavoprotein involved in K+ transport
MKDVSARGNIQKYCKKGMLSMQKYDVIIVGGGQAGLSIGYYLKKTALSFLILDKGSEVGEVWRKRYDSLTLFTPDFYSALPGSTFIGNRQSYPTKDEVANYLKFYAEQNKIPIQHNTEVQELFQTGGGFEIYSNKGIFHAQKVVVATGPFQKPFIPKFSKDLSKDVIQLHSSVYKNPQQLKDGPVLVVGGGNSGAQIAVELSKEREVYLSVGHKLKLIPLDVGKKSIFWYIDKFGLYQASKDSLFGRLLRKQKDPILGSDLKPLLDSGKIKLKARSVSVKGDTFHLQDNSHIKVNNVIWSTGFWPDYNWINISNLIDVKGFPVHERGVTSVQGLYFLGLPWLNCRSSALLGGVGKDAEYLFNLLINDLPVTKN